MKKFLILFIFFLFLSVHCQTYDWCIHDGKWSVTNKATHIINDKEGNVYVSGYFLHYLSYYPRGSYTAKYNVNGERLWLNRPDSTNIGYRIIDTDNQNNFYIAGGYTGYTITLGNITLTNHSGHGIFIAKLSALDKDLNGCVWAKEIEIPIMGICVDKENGDIFLTGNYSDPISIDTLQLPADIGYEFDGYLAKINTNGICQWLKRIGDRGGSFISVAKNKDLIISGELWATATFGTGGDSVTLVGENPMQDYFIAKYSKDGNLLNVREVEPYAPSGSNIIINDQKVDKENNIVLTGLFAGQYTFDSIITNKEYSSSTFLIKYDEDLKTKWLNTIPGSGNVGSEGKKLYVDQYDNIYLTGRIGDTAVIGSNVIENLNKTHSMFIAKYDKDGQLIWVQSAKADTASSRYPLSEGTSLCSDNKGSIWIAGNFTMSVYFGDSLFATRFDDCTDIFICKLHDDYLNNVNNYSIATEADFNLYPNPNNGNFIIECSKASKEPMLYVCDVRGRMVYVEKLNFLNSKSNISLGKLPKGIYFVRLKNEDSVSTRKIVIE
jgi:hypothetical protein